MPTIRIPPWSKLGLHVVAKPIGPICNLRCAYCFYLEKEAIYPEGEDWRMNEQTVEEYVRQYIEAQPDAVQEIGFTFQGGEPTLMGLDFYRKVVELQQRYLLSGKSIANSIQTNGILLDEQWCDFLRMNRFLVGISLDGPEDLHGTYRHTPTGENSFARVMDAVERMQRSGVEFNVLACINRANSQQPLRVYRFFRDAGIQHIQFIPVVRRCQEGLGQCSPTASAADQVSPPSVLPEQFGRFLCDIFDEWAHHDVGKVFISDFEQTLASWVGIGANICVYQAVCGRALALEHNGDLYACDHFVHPPFKLGNIHDTPIRELADLAQQQRFGLGKTESLPSDCRDCGVRFACNGACPKDRFCVDSTGEPGLNYLCTGYKQFFSHTAPIMREMAKAVRVRQPVADAVRRFFAKPPGGQGSSPARM